MLRKPSGKYSAINNIGGGEVWEEVDKTNIPTDFIEGDRIKISFDYDYPYYNNNRGSQILEFILGNYVTYEVPLQVFYSNGVNIVMINMMTVATFNTTQLFSIDKYEPNTTAPSTKVTRENASKYIYKMWRLKK